MNKKLQLAIVIAILAILGCGIFVILDRVILKKSVAPAQTPTTTPEDTSEINVSAPLTGDMVSSPLVVTGQARGSWYFEAVFPVKLVDDKGKIIASAQAHALSDWMTSDLVPFSAELKFDLPANANGTLILSKDNPSGLPENDKEISIPVRFAPMATTTVKVFFGNSLKNPETLDCSLVFPSQRIVYKTETIGRAALEQLLSGPTEEEKAQGFFTSINTGVTIQKLIIKNGTAEVDLSKRLEEAVGGSCRVTAISAEITQTLKQFPTVKKVIISIDGRTEDILQP